MERKDKENLSHFRKRKKDAFEIRFLYPLAVRGFVEKMAGTGMERFESYKDMGMARQGGARGSGRGGGRERGRERGRVEGEGGEGGGGRDGEGEGDGGEGEDPERRDNDNNEEEEGRGRGRGRERGRESVLQNLRELDTSSGGGTFLDVLTRTRTCVLTIYFLTINPIVSSEFIFFPILTYCLACISRLSLC